MNPLFFGDSKAPLFGMDHPPKGRTVSGRGIVLCAPMGQEYMRSHRAFRSLANRLARAGHHVFRFDYFGTGDSAGESHEGSPDVWRANIHAAMDELREGAALERVTLVGLRLGAALAALVASEREEIDQLILWDPVIDGSGYLQEMLESAMQPESGDPWAGVLGFPLTPAMQSQIAEIDPEALAQARATEIRIVTSSEDSIAQGLADALARQGVDARYACVPAGGRWNEVDNFGGALVPQEILQAIVQDVAAFEGKPRGANP